MVFQLSSVQGAGLLLSQTGLVDFNDVLSLEEALKQHLKSRQSVADTQIIEINS